MKRILLISIIMVAAFSVRAQTSLYDVASGNGNGLRFWSSDNYKIHMGNSAEYKYGPVTDYSIKMNMTSTAGRGWVWGTSGLTPIAALSNTGELQLANTLRTMKGVNIGFNRPGDAADYGLWINRGMSANGGGTSGNFTSIQLVEKDWSGTHAMLFNAYASKAQQNGSLNQTGNTLYKNDVGSYSSGAGAFMYHAHSGVMSFYISPESTGQGTSVEWGIPKLRIKRNGHVGIGTIDPEAKLTVEGGDIQVGKMGHFKGWTPGGLTGVGLDIGVSGDIGHLMTYDRTNKVYKSMRLAARGGSDRGLFISKNGNFGVDVSAPNYKLEVNGTLRAKEVLVEASPWPDYVFGEEYDLMSLEEVKTYIDQEGHLPNIPSAEEVESNGLAVGEMNIKLMEKVEELTLYAIEMQEKMKAQQAQIDALIKILEKSTDE